MNKLFSFVKKKFKQVLGHLPRRIPVGMAQFEQLITDLTSTYDLPTTDITSIKYVVATDLINSSKLNPTISLSYYRDLLNSAGCKQIASAVFYEIQKAKKDAQLAEAAKNESQK